MPIPISQPATTKLEKEAERLATETHTLPALQKIKEKIFSIGKNVLNVIDKMNYPYYAIGGILSGVGVKEGIKRKVGVSTALFGEKYLADNLELTGASKLVAKVTEFIGRLGIDILLDPVNWLTFSFGSVAKIVKVGDRVVPIAKTATDIASEFASNALLGSIQKRAPEIYKQLDNLLLGQKISKQKITNIFKEVLKEDPKLYSNLTSIYKTTYENALNSIKALAEGTLKGRQGYRTTKLVLESLGFKDVSDAMVKEVMEKGIPGLKEMFHLGIEMPFTGAFHRSLVTSEQFKPVLEKLANTGREVLKKIPGGNAVLENISRGNKLISDFLRSIGFGRLKWIKEPAIHSAISTARARIVNNLIFIDNVQATQFGALLKDLTKGERQLRKAFSLEELEELGKKFFLWDALRYGINPAELYLPKELAQKYPQIKFLSASQARELANELWKSFPEPFKKSIESWLRMSKILAREEMKRGLYEIQAQIYIPLVYRNKEKAIQYFSQYFKPDIHYTFKFGKHRTVINPLLLPVDVQEEIKPVWNIFEIIPARLKASAIALSLQDFAFDIAEKYGKYFTTEALQNLSYFKNENFVRLSDVLDVIPSGFYQKLPENFSAELRKLTLISQKRQFKAFQNYLNDIVGKIKEAIAVSEIPDVSRPMLKEFLNYLEKLSQQDIFDTLTEIKKARTLTATQIYAFKNFLKKHNLFFPHNLDLQKLTNFLNPDEFLEKVPIITKHDLISLKTPIPRELAEKFQKVLDVYIPQWVAEDIINYFGKTKGLENIEEFLRATNRLMGAFKFSVTVPWISFHTRNFRANLYKMFIESGWASFNPEIYKNYYDILKGTKDYIVSDIGEVITREQFLKELKPVRSVWITMLETAEKEGTIVETMKKLPVLGHYLRVMERAGSFIENNSRGLLYFALRKKGYSPEMALSRVNWALVDYNSLTKFEKSFVNNIFPFWKWYRQNIATELTNFVLKPGRYSQVADILNNLQQVFAPPDIVEEERKFLPIFVKNTANFLAEHKGDTSYFLWSLDIPLESAIKMTFDEPLKGWLSLLAPWIKIPFELTLDKNFFLEKKISEDTNGEFAKHYPSFFKDWLEYSEVKKKDKLGREYIVYYVNPYKKYVLQSIGPLMGAGRIFSQSFVRDVDALYKILTGKATYDDKIQFLHFLTGAMIYKMDRRIDTEKRLRELYDEYGDYLRRKGYIKTFKRYYDDKEKQIIEEYEY